MTENVRLYIETMKEGTRSVLLDPSDDGLRLPKGEGATIDDALQNACDNLAGIEVVSRTQYPISVLRVNEDLVPVYQCTKVEIKDDVDHGRYVWGQIGRAHNDERVELFTRCLLDWYAKNA